MLTGLKEEDEGLLGISDTKFITFQLFLVIVEYLKVGVQVTSVA
jgi:hypothetical protein